MKPPPVLHFGGYFQKLFDYKCFKVGINERGGKGGESRIKGTKGVVKIFLPFNASFTPMFVGDAKKWSNVNRKWSNFGRTIDFERRRFKKLR